jgi:hypothetical protein
MVVLDELSSFKNHKSKRFKRADEGQADREEDRRTHRHPFEQRPHGPVGGVQAPRSGGSGSDASSPSTGWTTSCPDKSNGEIIYSYKPLPGAEDAIYRRISDITISMKSTDHLKMPELISTEYEVQLSEDERNGTRS